MAPLVRRTWAPRGQSPVLVHRTRHRQKVSAIAAVVVSPAGRRVRLFFRLHRNKSICAAEVVEFLRQLHRQIGSRFLIVWDSLTAHRSARARDFLVQHTGIPPFFLPPYAPELNPVEMVWSHLKTNGLANFAALDFAMLLKATHGQTRRIQRRSALLRSFLAHSPLSFGPL